MPSLVLASGIVILYVAVVFDHADFSAQNTPCGLTTESEKRHVGD